MIETMLSALSDGRSVSRKDLYLFLYEYERRSISRIIHYSIKKDYITCDEKKRSKITEKGLEKLGQLCKRDPVAEGNREAMILSIEFYRLLHACTNA